MWKIVVPVVAGLGLLSLSARTAEAQGVDAHGRFCCPISPQQFRGKLDLNIVFTNPKPGAVSECFPFRVVWQLTVAGKKYELDFQGNKKLLEQAKKLTGQKVLLHGWPAGGTIRVVSLTADGPAQGPSFTLKALIGLDLGKARQIAQQHGYKLRVIMQDGVSFPITMDYCFNRINVAVVKGKVVSASIG
jgi:hypothetical protein